MGERTAVTQEQAQSKDRLKRLLEQHDTVYSILRHISRSGENRVIDLFVIKNNEPICITSDASDIVGSWDTKYEGIRTNGSGRDVGYEVVYLLSLRLFGDGKYLKHKWI